MASRKTQEILFQFDPDAKKLIFVDNQWTLADRGDHRPQGDGIEQGIFGFNDLAFDKSGGAYITDMRGSSALQPHGRVVYRSPDGNIHVVVPDGLALPDGIALSPDGRILYFNEWLGNRIFAVPIIEPGRLAIGMASVFAYLNGGKGPDGMTVDAAGNLYVAHQGGGGEIAVFAPDGSYYGAIRPKGDADFSPTNLTFIGDYLYVTEGRLSNDDQDGSAIWRVHTKTGGVKSK